MPASMTSAAALIPEDVARVLIEPLEAASVVLSSGPRIFDTSNPLSIPRLVGSTPAPGFVAENSLIPEAELTFDDVTLMPTSRRGIKVISRMSNESIRASVVALDAAVQTRLVGDVARTLDQALMTGTGATGSITGLVNQPGILLGTLALTNYDSFVDALGTWMASEVNPANGRWFVHPQNWTTLSKTKDTSGQYLAQPDVSSAATLRILGVPVTITSRVPAGTVLLVDTSMVAIGRDLAPSITVDASRYLEFDQTAVRIVARFDLALLHPQGVLKLTPAV